MSEKLTYEKIITQLENIKENYEIIRVVDPLNKKVLYLKENHHDSLLEINETCYNVWHKGQACINCVSMRALDNDTPIIKLDYNDNSIFMVQSIPFRTGETALVIELLKDVTKNMLIDDVLLKDKVELIDALKQANKAAMTDALTKVYNKRYLLETLPTDFVKSKISAEPLTLILADIDYFKKVNDTYGHDVGDKVLKQFAKILTEMVKTLDGYVTRYGGEEFLIVLRATTVKQGISLAETIRETIEKKAFNEDDKAFHLTASFGVASTLNVDNEEACIKQADQHLYKAKQTGRNKVIG